MLEGGIAGSAGSGNTEGGAMGTGCASLPLCDTFESGTVGSPPASSWTIINNEGASSSVAIDGIGAHGSSKSLKVVGSNRVWARNTTAIGTLGPKVYARFWVRFEKALATSHSAFIAMNPMTVDQYNQNFELRMGGQDAVFHWNNAINDHNVPPVSPNGDSKSFKPAAGTWYCVELSIDKPNGFLGASVDQKVIEGLTQDGVATPDIDSEWLADPAIKAKYATLADFAVGWASYGAGGNTVWFDDVALSNSPIGCD